MKKSSSKFYFILSIIIIILIFIPQTITHAKTNNNKENSLVNLYFFHSNTCYHCKEEEKFLKRLEKNYSNLNIYDYEIHEDKTEPLLKNVERLYDIKTNGVPITIIGEEVFVGYNESNNLKIIQTIEYYSKYTYQDKLGESIGITNLPFYKKDSNKITLEEFRKEYGNYNLIGGIQTNELTPNLIATITGILSGCNFLFIITFIIITIILKKQIASRKDKILLISSYFILNFLLMSTNIIKNKYYILIISIFILIILTWSLVIYYKNKRRQYKVLTIIIFMTLIINNLDNSFYNKYPKIFLELEKIHLLDNFSHFQYYANYFISVLLTQILILIILKVVINKINKKYYSY